MMKCARHILVYGALVWALLAPPIIYLRANGEDNIARKLRALAGARLGASPEEVKSDAVSIPRTSVDMIAELSREEERKDGFVLMLALVSSAVVVAFCLAEMTRLHRERHDVQR
jgi:hypothetical protein